jgi:hypothetical protein
MNRIAILRFDLFGAGHHRAAFVNKTSGLLRPRHVSENYFWSNRALGAVQQAAQLDAPQNRGPSRVRGTKEIATTPAA